MRLDARANVIALTGAQSWSPSRPIKLKRSSTRPGRASAAVLFYGTDAGLVSERATQLAGAVRRARDPPARSSASTTPTSTTIPDRLAVELQTTPMFGGPKVVRATAGRRINAAALKPLLEGGTLAGMLIVEAGNLKPDDALRALFEKSAQAAAVACYPDEAPTSRR